MIKNAPNKYYRNVLPMIILSLHYEIQFDQRRKNLSFSVFFFKVKLGHFRILSILNVRRKSAQKS